MPELTPHPAFMHRCLELASLGRGRVGNGALVGAVLVRDGRIIAEAFHRAYGVAHAERALFEGFQGKILPEDVLYVNLEPCCHQGKTPPCTDIIMHKGVKTVVFGMQDPDPRVAENGLQLLRTAGIAVVGPFDRALCERLNKGFIQVRRFNRPYITIKQAIGPGGRIANDDGSPMKITSSEQDAWSHQFLRARHDAILVGIGTVLRDNPQLNTRFDQGVIFTHTVGLNGNNKNENNSVYPLRIILDSELRVPLDAKVICDDEPQRTMICVTSESVKREEKNILELKKRGVRVVTLPREGEHFAWKALWDALVTPKGTYCGITSMLVEGGAKTWEIFRKNCLVDEEIILIGRDHSSS